MSSSATTVTVRQTMSPGPTVTVRRPLSPGTTVTARRPLSPATAAKIRKESPLEILSRAAGLVESNRRDELVSNCQQEQRQQISPKKGLILKRALKRGINHTIPTVPTIPMAEALKIQKSESKLKEDDEDSFDEQPLDMSVKRFKRGKSNESNKRRPSVIAFASNGIPKTSAASRKRRAELNGSSYSPDRSNVTSGSNVSPRKCSRTRVIIEEAKSSGETEMIIDEHFRRSLGAEKFKDLFMKNENTPSDLEDGVDELEKDEIEQASVDDHFAKALGSDYWLTLNKSIPKSSPKSFEKSRDGSSTTHESQEENIPK